MGEKSESDDSEEGNNCDNIGEQNDSVSDSDSDLEMASETIAADEDINDKSTFHNLAASK